MVQSWLMRMLMRTIMVNEDRSIMVDEDVDEDQSVVDEDVDEDQSWLMRMLMRTSIMVNEDVQSWLMRMLMRTSIMVNEGCSWLMRMFMVNEDVQSWLMRYFSAFFKGIFTRRNTLFEDLFNANISRVMAKPSTSTFANAIQLKSPQQDIASNISRRENISSQ